MGLLGWGDDRPKNSVEIWKRNVTLSEFNINKFTLNQRQRIFSAYNLGTGLIRSLSVREKNFLALSRRPGSNNVCSSLSILSDDLL